MRLARALLQVPLRFKVWGLVLGLLVLLGASLATGRRQIFVPGRTSDGHHLVEPDCSSCHGAAFAGVDNGRCLACHQSQLAENTHEPQMFDDPRWASTLARIDARSCVACHREHGEERHGVSVPAGFCFPCHDDVLQRRKSHADLTPDSCGNSGCHNYHDNSGLRAVFLAKHLGEPDLVPVPDRQPRGRSGGAVPPATAALLEADFPATVKASPELVSAWKGSAHARQDAGAGCRRCHEATPGDFRLAPGDAACKDCHGPQATTFGQGTHGIRSRLGLPGLRPADARKPMAAAALARDPVLGCSSCHDPHSVDTARAAVEACLTCHDDLHSKSFRGSTHVTSARPGEEVVTCSTCHLRRSRTGEQWTTSHDNSELMRPRERMVKQVCVRCHGMEYALSSVFDEALVASSFRGAPARPLPALKMVRTFAETQSQKRRKDP